MLANVQIDGGFGQNKAILEINIPNWPSGPKRIAFRCNRSRVLLFGQIGQWYFDHTEEIIARQTILIKYL